MTNTLHRETQKLYPDVPPTKLRNKDEKFRAVKTNAFWRWVADEFFFNMLENRFYSLKVKGIENYKKRNPDFANIAYAPHNNWWDGIVGYNVCRRVFETEPRMMIEEMNRFPILGRAGAFPVNKKSPQASMKALQYAVSELCDKKKTLWIFPQGIIRPPMYRPIEFQTGVAYIAQNVVKKAGGINLIPIAVNYPFLREDKPEVLCEIGEPIILTGDHKSIDRHALTQKMEREFEILCDNQFADITKGHVDEYDYLYKQKQKWYRRLEKKLKNIDIAPGSGV